MGNWEYMKVKCDNYALLIVQNFQEVVFVASLGIWVGLWIESYFLNVENLNLEASNVNQLVSGIGLKSVTYEKEMESLKTDMVADCVESICLCFGVCYACRLIDHS